MSNESGTTKQSHDLNKRKTQWHMAVTPAMKLEFMEYSQILHYDTGYLLNTNALEIDLLIIKKDDDTVIENEIGSIFRRHNIIEYKSPHDREGINTYQAFVELMQPEIDEAVNEAVSKAVSEAVNETVLEITAKNKVEAIENAMKKLDMSREDACSLMDTTLEEYDTYKKIVRQAAGRSKKSRKAASK